MADTNGSGRLDRVESVLEVIGPRLGELTETQEAIQRQHNEDFKKLMTWQAWMHDKFDRLAEKQEQTDERIRTLVSAIGEFVRGF